MHVSQRVKRRSVHNFWKRTKISFMFEELLFKSVPGIFDPLILLHVSAIKTCRFPDDYEFNSPVSGYNVT